MFVRNPHRPRASFDPARFKRGVNEAGWDQIRHARFWDRGIPEVTRKVNI